MRALLSVFVCILVAAACTSRPAATTAPTIAEAPPAVALTAVAPTAVAPIAVAPAAVAPEEADASLTEGASCGGAACNGVVRRTMFQSHLYCLCRTHDAGKECRDGTECEGTCEGDRTSEQVVRTEGDGSVYGYRLGHCSQFEGKHNCGAAIYDGAAANGPYLLHAPHRHLVFAPCMGD